MRRELCRLLVEAADRPDLVFLTGDLGFGALEPLRETLGGRFINAGVAEQNMVSVAAGLVHVGFRPWIYSIAPFLYARAFEQIRNDICLHNLAVVMVGNGGGYGYGVMGATHHALEDYGTLLCLPRLRVFIPAFANDLQTIIPKLFTATYPAYLRLGAAEKSTLQQSLPPYAAWRKLLAGPGLTMLVAGPLASGILEAVAQVPADRRPAFWLVSELPLDDVPDQFLQDVMNSGHLLVVEEHVVQGGIGQMIAHHLIRMGKVPPLFTFRSALGYVSGRYGSQQFHRKECGLDPASIVNEIMSREGT